MTVYALESFIYYECSSSTISSLHQTYDGALSAARRYMTEPDWTDPYYIATRTYYKRVPNSGGEIDRWEHGDHVLTICQVEVQP